MITIERLTTISELSALADLLRACVLDGASVGFIAPFPVQEAKAFWRDRVFPTVSAEGTDLFVARTQGRVVGTVQLVPAAMPNQTHRADVSKLLVHPDSRRLGIGRQLMQVLESRAIDRGFNLLVLDTRSGDPSQTLYQSIGFQIAGQIPGFCRNVHNDDLEATTYLYKRLP